MSTLEQRLGRTIRDRREQMSMTQMGLALRLTGMRGRRIRQGQVSRWEKAENPIRVNDLPYYAAALDTTVHYLLRTAMGEPVAPRGYTLLPPDESIHPSDGMGG